MGNRVGKGKSNLQGFGFYTRRCLSELGVGGECTYARMHICMQTCEPHTRKDMCGLGGGNALNCTSSST